MADQGRPDPRRAAPAGLACRGLVSLVDRGDLRVVGIVMVLLQVPVLIYARMTLLRVAAAGLLVLGLVAMLPFF